MALSKVAQRQNRQADVACLIRIGYDGKRGQELPRSTPVLFFGYIAMMSLLSPFLIYWLVMFVACFVVIEIGQDQLYDEVTPRVGLKVTGGSALIAMVLTALRYYGVAASFESMFTSNIAWTLLQGVVWFGVFTLIFQFHPWHALGIGTATMLMVTGLATMGVESILSRPAPTSAAARPFAPTTAVRQSLSPTSGAAQPAPAEKAK
jgi:magnesium-transporting ATPase (P-type)